MVWYWTQQPLFLQDSNESYGDSDSDSASYSFEYSVEHEYSGNNYGHEERRKGDYTEGKFYLLRPDGVFATYNYFVDGYSGFQVEAELEGSPEFDSGSYGQDSDEYGYGRGRR